MSLPQNDSARVLSVDRTLLRRSIRAVHVLRREFPRALPRIVGDVGRWADAHLTLCDVLKGVVHEGQALESPPVDRHPLGAAPLGPDDATSRAFLWAWWTRGEAYARGTEWLQVHRDLVETLEKHRPARAAPALIRIYQLEASHGRRRTQPLIDTLRSNAAWSVPLRCSRAYLEETRTRLERGKPLPDVPKPRVSVALLDVLDELPLRDESTQRRILDLLRILDSVRWAADWQQWWSAFTSSAKSTKTVAGVTRLLDVARKSMPPAVDAALLMGLLRALLAPEQEKLAAVFIDVLPRWRETLGGGAARFTLAHHWLTLWQRSDSKKRPALRRLIEELTAYGERHGFTEASLTPWASLLESVQKGKPRTYGVDDDILEDLKSREAVRRFFAALDQGGRVSAAQAEFLVSLVSTFPGDRVNAVFDALRDSPHLKHHIPNEVLVLLSELSGTTTSGLESLLGALLRTSGNIEAVAPGLRLGLELFSVEGLAETYSCLLQSRHRRSIIQRALKLSFLRSRREVLPEIEQFQSVVERTIPDALEDAAMFLARFDPNADRTLERILAKDLPKPTALVRELDALRKRTNPTEALKKRIANLERRLVGAPGPSVERLETLKEKIREAGRTKLVERWLRNVDAAYHRTLLELLDLDAPPDWLDDDSAVSIVGTIGSLTGSTRSLAIRLLQARSGPTPWDLRDAPENKRFLLRLKSRGLEIEHWLDASITEVDVAGQSLAFAFETDPLEVFRMGEHFNTCLRPGSFNYFSVFSNAADINKQVLFARDSEGKVFGRTLLALTDDGGILPFHSYCHARQDHFRDAVKDHVNSLAARMRTLVVDTGHVSTLVSTQWYDDGPVDLTSESNRLENNRTVAKALKSGDPAEAMELVRRALAPLPLNELTLPRVFALPAFRERADLLATIYPLARRTQLPGSVVLPMAHRLFDAGMLDASATADWIVEVIERTSTDGSSGPAVYAAETLLDIAPARALALLKQSWPRHIRKWSDDEDGWRLMVAGAANRRLGRKNRAYALYRLALEVHYNKGMKAMCREALDALRPEADAPHRRRKRSAWSSGPAGPHGNEAVHRTT